MGLKLFQARAHDILAQEPPSHVPTSRDRPLEQNENNGALNCAATSSSSLLPPLSHDEPAANEPISSTIQGYSLHQNTPRMSPQNMPQYRNVFNDRARRNFCYWVIEKKGLTCKGYSFGAYKTSLGLPKV